MKMPERPCPQCGSAATKRIAWTEDEEKLARPASAGFAYVRGPWTWNESADIDRVCTACQRRFCNDLAAQARYDEDTCRQKRRAEAQKRGEYQFFNARTMSADEIADAVIRKFKLYPNSEQSDAE